jgi:hypothetical protein
LPDIIEIIKKRFPEVILIVGFQAGLFFLLDQLANAAEPYQNQTEATHMGSLPMGMDVVLGLGIAVCVIAWQLLSLGFLRTAFVNGAVQQDPKTLIMIGRAFFWRMFRFQVIFGFVYIAIASFISSLMISAMYKDVPISDLPDWVMLSASFLSTIIIIKPLLLSPAIMIVSGCMVKDSFSKLKNFKPLADPLMLRLFIAFIATAFVFSTIETLTKTGSIAHHIILAIQGITTSSLWLIVSLYTIKFIADRTKPVTEPAENPEGENAQNL